MSIYTFVLIFTALFIINCHVTYFINDRIFYIKGVFTRQFASWAAAIVVSTVFWIVCKLNGIELPYHYAFITIGIAGFSNGFYDLRHSPL